MGGFSGVQSGRDHGNSESLPLHVVHNTYSSADGSCPAWLQWTRRALRTGSVPCAPQALTFSTSTFPNFRVLGFFLVESLNLDKDYGKNFEFPISVHEMLRVPFLSTCLLDPHPPKGRTTYFNVTPGSWLPLIMEKSNSFLSAVRRVLLSKKKQNWKLEIGNLTSYMQIQLGPFWSFSYEAGFLAKLQQGVWKWPANLLFRWPLIHRAKNKESLLVQLTISKSLQTTLIVLNKELKESLFLLLSEKALWNRFFSEWCRSMSSDIF